MASVVLPGTRGTRSSIHAFSCLGLIPKGAIGATTAVSLDESGEPVPAIRAAAASVRPDVIALCHDGPIAEPGDAGTVLDHTAGGAGFFGASSIERLPTEVAITENMRRFERISRTAGVR
jgi:predicted TIM-barrel enzyme